MTGVFMKGWISLQDDCTIDYHVCAEVTEFTLGGFSGPETVATERGLETLLAKGTEALERMRARATEPDEDDDLV
jgi:hypothetical protein